MPIDPAGLPLWLAPIFFVIALVYSSAGFAGGSSYAAMLLFIGVAHNSIPPVSLACNLMVSAVAFRHFYKGGHFDLKKILPFVVSSVPLSYLGARMTVGKHLFSWLLGISLLAAGTRLWLAVKNSEKGPNLKQVSARERWAVGLPLGAGMGFLSGVVGIGGGIFLSPILLLMKWADAKQAASAASFFILINSLSGLIGQTHKGVLPPAGGIGWLLCAVAAGGWIGSHAGSFRLPRPAVQRVTAALMLYVSFHLIGRTF
jgi:uncharacterized protein